jgi:hypothetical protein
MSKASFLKHELVPLLATIPVERNPQWGKMNAHQMMEHLNYDTFQVASGKKHLPLQTPTEHLAKMQQFIRSDKPFKENTPNKLMPETPTAPIHENVSDALKALQQEINLFFDTYFSQPELRFINPFFGALDYELQVLLLYKHCRHHLTQFGITTN